MKTYFILRVLLALHLVGLTIMAGTTIIDYLTFKTFWRMADKGDSGAFSLVPLMSRYGAFMRAGAAVLVLTGISMLLMVKGAWWQQLWFKIKMPLVVTLVLNGMLIGNRLGLRLRNMAHGNLPGFMEQSAGTRAGLDRFYITQLVLFSIIILVSVIKFDKSGI